MLPQPITRLRFVSRLAVAALLSCSLFARPTFAQTGTRSEWPDDHWAQVADSVPGFAGWWRAGQSIVLMLVDTTQRDSVLKLIRAELPRGYRIRVHKADFDFRDLSDWKHEASGAPGVVMADADEIRNRLVVGVCDSAAVIPTRARLLAMGIPPEALILEVSGPFRW